MRAYSTQRPVDIGTYPKDRFKVKEIVNFDDRKFCPEISRKAWGYIEYEGYLPRKSLDDYELVTQEYRIADEWNLLKEAYDETRGQDPKKTLEVLQDVLDGNLDILKITLSAYAAIRKHDGRISEKNREYYKEAPTLPDAVKWESGNPVISMGLDDIHPANVDQIMTALRTANA